MQNKTVLISPFAQALRNGKENPKNFPYWKELVALMKAQGIKVIQIGSAKDSQIPGTDVFIQNPKMSEIRTLIQTTDTWISVDSFLQHLNRYYDRKKGIVIFSQSDPLIFGYKDNINLLKDRDYLRTNQFWWWEQCEYNTDAFVTAEDVMDSLLILLDQK